MVIVEILVGLIIATVILAGISKIGAPIADAFADRLKLKFQELGPEQERELRSRVEFLENEVRSLQQQVNAIRDTDEFAAKLHQGETLEDAPSVIRMQKPVREKKD